MSIFKYSTYAVNWIVNYTVIFIDYGYKIIYEQYAVVHSLVKQNRPGRYHNMENFYMYIMFTYEYLYNMYIA